MEIVDILLFSKYRIQNTDNIVPELCLREDEAEVLAADVSQLPQSVRSLARLLNIGSSVTV